MRRLLPELVSLAQIILESNKKAEEFVFLKHIKQSMMRKLMIGAGFKAL